MNLFVKLFALTLLAGCSGKVTDGGTNDGHNYAQQEEPDAATGGTGVPPALVGSWDMTSTDGPEDRSDYHQATSDFLELDFRADGTVTLWRSGICSAGTYTYTAADHHLHFSPEGLVVDVRAVPDAGLLEFTRTGMSISYVAPTNFWGNFTHIAQLNPCQ